MRLTCYERRLKNLSLDFASCKIEFDTALHLTSLFLKRQTTLKSLSTKFQKTRSGDLAPFSKSLQKHGSSLASLNLDFSPYSRMREEWIRDLTSRGLSNLPNLKKLSLKLGIPFDKSDLSLAFNLKKSKDLIFFSFNFWQVYTGKSVAGLVIIFGDFGGQISRY